MLASLRLARGSTCVHQEQGRFGVQRNRLDDVIPVIMQHIVDEEIPPHDHGRLRAEMPRIALPDENFVDGLAFFLGGFHGNVGAGL